MLNYIKSYYYRFLFGHNLMNKFKILKLKVDNIQNLKLKKIEFLITSNLRIQIINPDKNMRKFQKYIFSPRIRIFALKN
jgi:hypothetical protein